TLTVPYLLWCNIAIHKAVATAAACGLPIALAATLTFIIIGWQLPGLPAASTGFVYWPAAVVIMIASIVTAPLGARLAHALPVLILKRVFAVVLILVGLRMIF
ncbi:MAG: sulfite exporter TauE/SafE family protein, partial [Gammaproteobacteria bacterium]